VAISDKPGEKGNRVTLEGIRASLRRELRSTSDWEQIIIAIFLALLLLIYASLSSDPIVHGVPKLIDKKLTEVQNAESSH
jgi:squalene cyclase